MIRLIVFLVLATALAVGAVWLADQPGSTTVEWQGQVVEVSTSVAFLVLGGIVIVAILIFELLRWLRVLPQRIAESSRHKKEVKGYKSLVGGLVAAAAGDSKKAKALKIQADQLLGSNPSNLLLGVQAAQLDGDDEVAEVAYRRMLKSPQTSLLGLRGLLSQAVKLGDYEEAAKLAKEAYEKSPGTAWVLDTYFDILARQRNWPKALKLIDEMARAHTQSEGDLTHKRAVLNHMIAAGYHEKGDDAKALPFAKKAVKLCPDFAPAAVQGAVIAAKAGRIRVGKRMVEDAWSVEPHPDLAEAFGNLIKNENPQDRKKRWRRLLDLRPNHVETYIALGDVALADGDKVEARKYAEAAVEKGGTVRAYQLLARVERETGAGDETIAKLREKATDAKLDPAWVCQDTGETVARWQPFGLSGRFDAIGWVTPPKVSQLLRLAAPNQPPAANDEASKATASMVESSAPKAQAG